MENKEIKVNEIGNYVGKPILLSYGDITFGWAGIFQEVKFINPDDPEWGGSYITVTDCCNLINRNEVIPAKDADFTEKYVSDGQLEVHELSEYQLKLYNKRLKFFKEK